MTCSETTFRNWYKKTYPDGFIIKWPDYKQTNLTHSAGIPDYLTIHNGTTIWYEVKTWKNKTFTEAQKYMFPIMQKAGAIIYVWTKEKRGHTLKLYN